MDQVERHTDWRSGQFKRRVVLWTNLPKNYGAAELRSIAQRIAAGYSAAMTDELVDFAIPARRQIDAMTRAISGAQFIAEEKGRKSPAPRDLLAGIAEAQQTDLALTTESDTGRQVKAGRRKPRQQPGSAFADAMPEACGPSAPELPGGSENILADMQPPDRGMNPRGLVNAPA